MPLVGRHPHRPRALVAAASQVADSQSIPFRPEPDSDRLWGYYHALGEVWYVANFKAQAARRLTYFVGRQTDPSQDPEDVPEGPAREALERVQGPTGDFGDLVAELCPHLTVVGEGFFVWNAAEEFDVWSSDEMRLALAGEPVKRHQDDTAEVPQGKVRIWRPDPQWRHKADAPLRSVQTEADTIILLRDMIQALTRSRLPGKLLGIPEELTFPSDNPDEEQPGSDAMLESLIQAIVTSVTDSKSAARFAPIIIRGPGDALGKVQVWDLTRDMPDWINTLLDQSVSRLANGLDFPAAMLVGLEDLNHWSAWVVEESTYKQHVDPLVQMILDSLTRGYLWPYLEASGVSDPRSYRFWRDYSDLTARTASVETTLKAWEGSLVSDEAARMYLGYNEADAPEEDKPTMTSEDLNQRVNAAGILIRSGFTPEAALAAVGMPPIDHTGLLPVTVKDDQQLPAEGGAEPADITDDPAPDEMPAGGDNVLPGPPLTASAVATSLGDIDRRLYLQLSEAAQAAVDRALEKAGNRIRTEVRGGGGNRRPRHPAFAQVIDGQTGRHIGLALGRQTVVETLQLTDGELVPEGTFDAFGERATQILERGQDQTYEAARQLIGDVERDPEQERTWRERARDFLVAALSALTLSRLFTPDARPDPATTGEVNDTAVPAGDIFDALTIAGGGEPAVGPDQPRGLATGAQTEQWIEAADVTKAGWMWQHGSPSIPFEPHLQLNGTTFERWTSEVLSTPASASWLHTPYMFPGDHRGCTCVAVPILEEVTDDLA